MCSWTVRQQEGAWFEPEASLRAKFHSYQRLFGSASIEVAGSNPMLANVIAYQSWKGGRLSYILYFPNNLKVKFL